MIKVFPAGGRGGDTFNTPSYEQLLPLPTPCFKMFLERSFNDPHHPTSSTFHCYPLPIHHPFPPKNFDRTSNPSFTKPFGTHTFYQGRGGVGNPPCYPKNRCPHEREIL